MEKKNLNKKWKELCSRHEGFPIWKYHKEVKPMGLIVYSPSDLEALEDKNPGWVDSPADFEKQVPKKVAEKHLEDESEDDEMEENSPVEVEKPDRPSDNEQDDKSRANSGISEAKPRQAKKKRRRKKRTEG